MNEGPGGAVVFPRVAEIGVDVVLTPKKHRCAKRSIVDHGVAIARDGRQNTAAFLRLHSSEYCEVVARLPLQLAELLDRRA